MVRPIVGGLLLAGIFIGAVPKSLAEVVTIEVVITKLDLKNRRIVVGKSAGDNPKEIDLEVDKKAKITSEGEEIPISLIRPGQKAAVSFETKLQVVTKIEIPPGSGELQNKAKGHLPRYEALNLSELNSAGWEMGQWVSPDGLEMYWSTTPSLGGKEFFSIWSAKRKDSAGKFEGKQKLFLGHSPVLSSDCLHLYFRNPDSETIGLATRKSREEDFGNPLSVPSLSFPGMDPAPRWLSSDGLTLYMDMKDEDGKYYTWEVSREMVGGEWGSPRRTGVNIKGVSKNFRFVQISGTGDERKFLCMAEFSGNVTKVGVLTRGAKNLPFSEWRELPLVDKSGKQELCLKPQFVDSTKELYFNSQGFFSRPGMKETQKSDIWVIKQFELLKPR